MAYSPSNRHSPRTPWKVKTTSFSPAKKTRRRHSLAPWETLREPIGPANVRLGTTRARTAARATRGQNRAHHHPWLSRCATNRSAERPRLFDLHIKRPTDLYREVVEIDERVDSKGNVLQAPT
ncbi:MAG: hydantoinase/oxoprolinase N-terminal domain-containing protein [Planctomycetota bacterium]